MIMGEKKLRDLISIAPEWPIPQLQEYLAAALEGSGAALSTSTMPTKQTGDEIALVVKTSGSTGEAKSVMLAGTALIASTNSSHKYLGATPGDSWSLLLPTSHIAGLNVLIRATALGSRVIDNRNVDTYIDADFVSVVPTQLHKALTSDPKLLEHLTAAEAVLVGGAPLSDKLKKDATNKHIKVVSTYGMSEMSGGCVYNQKPIDGVEIAITAEGVIKLKGPMLAAGYLLDSGKINNITNDGWFISSDFGVYTDGLLKVLGRVDNVIISGGEKVSLDLVDQRIKELLPQVDFITFPLPDKLWGQMLCIGVTSDVQLEMIKEKLGSILTPKKVFLFNIIPVTPLGKPDRNQAAIQALKIKESA